MRNYRIYAEDGMGNQISKNYIVKNPKGILVKLLVLYIKILCLDHFDEGGEIYIEPIAGNMCK